MNLFKKILFLVINCSLVSISVLAAPKVSECEKAPEFLNLQKTASLLKGLEALPNMIFVGRIADHYVQTKSGNLKMWSQHSFKLGKSSILCASARGSMDFISSIYAPTLLDQSRDRSVGNSFWQFQLVSENQKFGVWNRKSRLLNSGESIEKALLKLGIQVQVFQVTHEEFDLVFTKETETAIEVLAIRYDSVPSLK
jgi:hypothetical protein